MTRSDIRRYLVLHNSPEFRGITGRVVADLVNYTAAQQNAPERAVMRKITGISVMDCYDDIAIYVNLRGGDWKPGGKTVTAYYWKNELAAGIVSAHSNYKQ